MVDGGASSRSTDVRDELVAVGRAALTLVTWCAVLGLFVLALDSRDGEPGLLLVFIASAMGVPLLSLGYAAPTFRIRQYLLNGGLVVFAFPLIFYALFDTEGSRDPAPASVFAGMLVSIPGLLGLGRSALVWGAVRRVRPTGATDERSSPELTERQPDEVDGDARVSRLSPDDSEALWMAARGGLAVVRASLTSISLIGGLGMFFFMGAHFQGGPEERELTTMILGSAVVFPLVAFLYAAPGFRIPEYVLNGGFAVVLFPIIVPLLYPSRAIEGSLPYEAAVAIRFSGPALVSLLATTVAWIGIRRMRRLGSQATRAAV